VESSTIISFLPWQLWQLLTGSSLGIGLDEAGAGISMHWCELCIDV